MKTGMKSLRGFRVGDRIRFDTQTNLGVIEDTIRALFMQTVYLEPYARNQTFPAAVLTEHSWVPLAGCTKVTHNTVKALYRR